MISPDRKWMPLWSLRFTVVILTFPIGCAKSQPPAEELQQPIDTRDAIIWTAGSGLETTRTRFADFELVEVERAPQDELVGHFEGQEVVIIPRSEGLCLDIVFHQDLDADGWEDLVVGQIGACNGACCQDRYFVVSYRGHGEYVRNAPQGAALHTPTLSLVHGKWFVNIENGTLDPFEAHAAVERFSLVDGRMTAVEVLEPTPMAALQEIGVGAYDSLAADAAVEMRYDLDGDGVGDLISGKLSPQWGRVRWSLQFGNGTLMDGGAPFKRLGILPTQTDGKHDLVVDRDRVFVWTGKRYEELED